MEIIDLRETRDLVLLERAYNGLYLHCFTDPNEQEDLEQYRSRLFDAQLPAPQPVTHFLIAIENQGDSASDQVLGMLICEFYRGSACGLLTYLAVVPGLRRTGLGRRLVEHAIKILRNDCTSPHGLQAVFAETHDPQLIDAAREAMPPAERIEVMRRLGAYRLPIRYVQPALRPGSGRSANLVLLTFPTRPGESTVTHGAALQLFLDEFYRALGVAAPAMDQDFQVATRDIARAVNRDPDPDLVSATDRLGLPLAPLLTPDRPMFKGGTTTGLLLAWLLAVIWYYGFGHLISLIPDHALLRAMDITEASPWVVQFSAKHLLISPLHFLLQVLRGAVAFFLVVIAYRTPFLLLVRSTFPFDEPLAPDPSWKLLRHIPSTGRRILEILFYYANLISLSAVRRFLYVATHPVFYWKFWRVFNLSPNRLYTKLQVYFEAELFHPRAANERPREYGERIAAIYDENLRILDRGQIPVSKCRTCFDVFGANHDKIVEYFKAQVSLHRDPKFLTRIEFENGYLAPTYLVSGLLNEFDEDWTKIVNAYPDMVARLATTDPLHDLPKLRKLQSFIWDCWVQWGPSVPISADTAWRSGEVALQFGYGDENNSLPLRWNPPGSSTHGWTGARFEDWQQKLNVIKAETLKKIPECGWAWPVTVSGNLRWLVRSERNSKFCLAQFAKAAINFAEPGPEVPQQRRNQPDEAGWLVFDGDRIEANPDAPLFYSAYLWVLIAICRSTDEPLPESASHAAEHQKYAERGYRLIHAEPQDRWRCLIPFFQHANIADVAVYEAIKSELALKTIETLIQELRTAQSAGIDWLHFAFVAAYDDNGDAAGSELVSPCPGDSIHEIMDRLLKSRFAAEPLAKRIHSAHGACAELTACDMPQVVRTYLNHVDKLSQ
ncbi:MAG: hypothetical protein JWM11_1830 [Planctomycetaceae bacterium]|nr:hypothetical protein [Planctomycetaceae bacterium]